MAVDYPVRAKIDDKDLDILISKLRAAGKEAKLSEKEIDQLAAGVKSSSAKATSSLSSVNKGIGNITTSLGSMAKAFAVGFISAAVVGMNEKLRENAIRLEAIDRKATVVFGRYKNQVEAIARSTANSLGLSESSFINATAAAADLLVPMGFARQEATQMSVELIKLSGALAEWTGGQRTSSDVSSILTKALLGEREQLKELGISIREADVQARLADKGQSKLTGTVLEQAKAMATLELILDKSTDAQQAFEDGGDSLARQNAITEASFSDLGDRLTELFRPAIQLTSTAVTTLTNDLKVLGSDLDIVSKLGIILSGDGTNSGKFLALDNTQDSIKGIDEQITELTGTIEKLKEQQQSVFDKRGTIGNQEAIKQYELLGDKISEVQAKMDSLKKAQAEGVGSGETAQVPLLQKLNEQLETAKKLRDEAITEDQLSDANRQIQLLETEIKRLKELGQVAKQLKKDAKLTDLIPDIEPIQEQTDKLRKAIEKAFGKDFFPDLAKKNKDYLSKIADDIAGLYDQNVDNQQKQDEALAGSLERRRFIFETGLILADSFISTLSSVRDQQLQDQLNRLDLVYQHELDLAGNNQSAREAIERQRDLKERELLNKQAQRQQRTALFEMAINQGPAIAKTAATLGFPLAIPFIAAIGALFAVQLGKTKSVEPPRFKDGVFDLQGPGTETSDSIDAKLSRRESVVSARKSKKFAWLLKPMIEDNTFTDKDLKQLVDSRLPLQLRGDLFTRTAPGENGVNRQLKDIEKAIKSIPGSRINIDKDGISLYMQQGRMWTEYVNKRYSSV